MTDRSRELGPDSWSLVKERALTMKCEGHDGLRAALNRTTCCTCCIGIDGGQDRMSDSFFYS